MDDLYKAFNPKIQEVKDLVERPLLKALVIEDNPIGHMRNLTLKMDRFLGA